MSEPTPMNDDRAGSSPTPTTTPVRRMTLETAHAYLTSDYVVITTWIDDDILHVATCDYSDHTDRTAWGEDIPDTFGSFVWMVNDRFGVDRRRLLECTEQHGSPCALEPDMDPKEAASRSLSIVLNDEGRLSRSSILGGIQPGTDSATGEACCYICSWTDARETGPATVSRPSCVRPAWPALNAIVTTSSAG